MSGLAIQPDRSDIPPRTAKERLFNRVDSLIVFLLLLVSSNRTPAVGTIVSMALFAALFSAFVKPTV
jgi:hypothetical protein